ncbi:TetR/AcrR family transcriptional regulator [Streptomyces torulosus]|uniref:TetR/AcrR family transcriptional regulator n=1 Tax=Streptomyces torulosus TaxID=68276 RepID=UPI0006EB9512|nr:TetR/AcrR family transcriptional regulator [Streptomyces torulosus]
MARKRTPQGSADEPGRRTPPAARTPRGSYAVGDERRQRILDTAVDHFARWGFHASSLARIAKDAGITQGGLLHHFPSKEDLLLHVLERADATDREGFLTHEFESAAEMFSMLVRLAEHDGARVGQTRMFNVLAAEAGDPGHPAHAYFAHRYAELVEVMAGVLRRAAHAGELRPDTDAVAVAHEVAAVLDGLRIQWGLDPRGFDLAGRFRAFVERVLRALSVSG